MRKSRSPRSELSPAWARQRGWPECAWRVSAAVWWGAAIVLAAWSACAGQARDEHQKVKASFRVKYVAADAVYLDGGSSEGLAEGQKLTIKRKVGGGEEEPVVAEIEIESVASASAVGKVISASSDILPGDTASLSAEDKEKLRLLLSSRDARKYPQIVSFSEGDPLDEEVRENLPKPPLPEVNRARGRIGLDYGYMQQPGGGTGYTQFGFMLRIDATRLAGTYWNLSGYYRGRLHSQGEGSQQPTLIELINRTYHLSLSYDNPNSRWVAGFGRLYIPWASSLSTIDGFYLGRRHGRATLGVFGGSAPDPTSWSYDPNRQMAGGFVNFEEGSYESFRFTSTSGVAISRVNWHPDRQFGFFENGLYYKRYVSVYSDIETDFMNGSRVSDPVTGSQDSSGRGLQLSRSYLTVRLQPMKVLSLDISENYFRNIPTFDERLIGTGLLDRYLFQGLSGGFRLELPHRTGIYSSIGRSSRTGDARASWDYLTGVTAGDIMHTGVRADFRYSKFDSSFGRGTYRSLMLSRELGEGLRFDLQVGQQDFVSELTRQNRARFINGDVDWFLSAHYYLGLGMTVYRGEAQNYNQSYLTLGYRFDNRRHRVDAQQIH